MWAVSTSHAKLVSMSMSRRFCFISSLFGILTWKNCVDDSDCSCSFFKKKRKKTEEKKNINPPGECRISPLCDVFHSFSVKAMDLVVICILNLAMVRSSDDTRGTECAYYSLALQSDNHNCGLQIIIPLQLKQMKEAVPTFIPWLLCLRPSHTKLDFPLQKTAKRQHQSLRTSPW